MDRRLAHQLLNLRTIIAALGEISPSPWWRTQFLSDAGLRATCRIFPRTALSAAVNSVSEAARLDHDRKVGVGRRYHLFRLPTEWEEAVTAILEEPEHQIEAKQLLMSGRDGLLKKLEIFAKGAKHGSKEGPVSIGLPGRIGTTEAMAELAANYLLAFSKSQRCYPYFEEEERRA